MRIIHTSDWHLGRSFAGFRLLDDQKEFLAWLAGVVADREVELVVISGDLYDRSVPPADAVAVFRDAVAAIRVVGARVVAIAGNHDSPQRVAAFDGLTEAAGLILRGGYERADTIDVLDFADGPLAIAAVPFLDPIMAPPGFRPDPENAPDSADPPDRLRRLTHADVLEEVLGRVRQQTEAQPRSLVLAHAYVTGGTASSSERELGGTGQVPAHLFDGFSYVALGHLHQPQRVGGSDTIRYSGSPLAYSFSPSETGRPKQVVLVDLAPDGAAEVEEISVPVGRPARLLSGEFEEILAGADLVGQPFVRVELTDTTRIIDAHRRLRDKFPNLAELDYVGGEADGSPSRPTAQAMAELSPMDHVRRFWEAITASLLDDEMASLVESALERVERRES